MTCLGLNRKLAGKKKMKIELNWSEQLIAAQTGVMRRLSAIHRDRSKPIGIREGFQWDCDIEGSGAEAAVAKALNQYWLGFSQEPHKLAGDVGNLQVRSTKHRHGRLILHTADPDRAIFILVRGAMPKYEVVGWLRAKDGKKDEYRFTGDGRKENLIDPPFYVPNDKLNDISTIPKD